MKRILGITLMITTTFLFSSSEINHMQTMMNSSMEFNKAKEIIKFEPIKMNKDMNYLYSKYKNGDEYSGFMLAKLFYKKERYVDAGEILSEVITSKNVPAEAFTLLGDLFIHGKGVSKDCLKGGMFYMGGLSSGDCNAFTRMKEQYLNGFCVQKNIIKASKIEKAEKQCFVDKKNGKVRAKKINNKMVIQK